MNDKVKEMIIDYIKINICFDYDKISKMFGTSKNEVYNIIINLLYNCQSYYPPSLKLVYEEISDNTYKHKILKNDIELNISDTLVQKIWDNKNIFITDFDSPEQQLEYFKLLNIKI
ncbi:hypothetical protein ACFSKN_04640 [Mariniflexile gromovii]|uniref:Uncharacterized protein n=1 Tax=Mariniflexile gromovii TaxID=362523 RepID=A0ABS4BWA0_9FLAO|nr:hypothetical protein [Mariniflexile gromovii]MBP0904865.1 hypothetical protein [Mariniflexile gromovii]